MDEMYALQEEQQKAGMLLEDGAPVRLNVSMALVPTSKIESAAKENTLAFGAEEEGVEKKASVPTEKEFRAHRTSTPFSTVHRDNSPPLRSWSDSVPLVWM
jgi:hypothetical protein